MALLSRFSWREKFLSTLDMGGSILAGSVKVNSSRPFVFFFFSLFFLLEFISKRTASQSQPWYSKRYYVATPVSRPPYIMRCARAYLSTYIPRFKGVLRVFLINFHRKKLEVLEIFVFALKEKKKKERKKTNFFVNIFIQHTNDYSITNIFLLQNCRADQRFILVPVYSYEYEFRKQESIRRPLLIWPI